MVLSMSALACAGGFSPAPTPQVVAAMPDTVPCDSAVKVRANDEASGIRAERRWLDAFYPKHSPYQQGLRGDRTHKYDVLRFDRADGRHASVCFDITGFYGHW